MRKIYIRYSKSFNQRLGPYIYDVQMEEVWGSQNFSRVSRSYCF